MYCTCLPLCFLCSAWCWHIPVQVWPWLCRLILSCFGCLFSSFCVENLRSYWPCWRWSRCGLPSWSWTWLWPPGTLHHRPFLAYDHGAGTESWEVFFGGWYLRLCTFVDESSCTTSLPTERGSQDLPGERSVLLELWLGGGTSYHRQKGEFWRTLIQEGRLYKCWIGSARGPILEGLQNLQELRRKMTRQPLQPVVGHVGSWRSNCWSSRRYQSVEACGQEESGWRGQTPWRSPWSVHPLGLPARAVQSGSGYYAALYHFWLELQRGVSGARCWISPDDLNSVGKLQQTG